jgi:hypothetical protein
MKLSNRNSTLPQNPTTWTTVFVAVLFFLCSADQFFTTRLFGFNFRWGQILLALWAIVTVLRRSQDRETLQEILTSFREFISTWGPFFAAYTLAAFLSPQPQATLIKAGWGLFNICLAFFLFSGVFKGPSLEKGMKWGITAIALTIWAQAIFVFILHLFPNLTYGFPSIPLPLHLGGFEIPLGYAQPDYSFGFDRMVRPNAFYYEPSYAGCALGFALPLLWATGNQDRPWQRVLFVALVWTAIILTTSRSGLLDLGFAGMSVLAIAFLGRDRGTTSWIGRSFLAGALMLGLFALSPFADDYLGTFLGVKGPDLITHLGQPQKSEGGRIASLKNGIKAFESHPFLGNGVARDDGTGRLVPSTTNTWLEIAMESGVIGLLAFLYAISRSIKSSREGVRSAKNFQFWVFVGLTLHLFINLNLTQTFPRLDYWILFFFALRLLRPKGQEDRP